MAAKPNVKDKDAVINVGFMKYCKLNRSLKKCRGKTLPIITTPQSAAGEIKDKAVRKHANHDKSMHDGFEYVLLYPDGSEIINLPGTSDPFILEKYSEDVGRPYNRITLFLSLKSDLLFSEMPTCSVDMGDEPEDDDTSDDEKELMKSVFDVSEVSNSLYRSNQL